MPEFTNLAWPDTPFGAQQRPYGRRSHMVCAVDVTWPPADRPQDAGRQLACVALVYLRVEPARTMRVEPATLPVGFRAAVRSEGDDPAELLGVLDGALVGALRHARVLAGRQLGPSLARLDALAPGRRRGITSTFAAWGARAEDVRGRARLRDTADQATSSPVDPRPRAAPQIDGPVGEARDAVTSCLAIALTAAAHEGLLAWDGRFSAGEAVDAAGWDVLAPAQVPGP